MTTTYNLRSSKRLRLTSNQNCYLKNYFENKSPETFNPKVCLERLNFIDSNNIHNYKFYIDKDRITIKQDGPILFKKKCFFKYFSIILLTLCLLYYKDEVQLYGNNIAKVFAGIYPAIQNFYFHTVKLQKSYLKLLTFKIQNQSNDNAKSKNLHNFILKSTDNDFKIMKLVKDNLVEVEDSNKFENSMKISESFIEKQCKEHVKDNLKIFFDETNITDYALESLGAEIVTTFNTEPYGIQTVKFLNFNIWPPLSSFLMKKSKYFSTNGPSSILVPWKKPGDCWAFQGSQGRVQIKLAEKIFVTAVTVDHISKKAIFDGSINSAPKKFSVIGIEEPGVSMGGKHLGTFEYRSKGPPSQTFLVQSKMKMPFRWIEINIQSNHGNDNYTCIYKIRVHGHK